MPDLTLDSETAPQFVIINGRCDIYLKKKRDLQKQKSAELLTIRVK